MVIGLGHYLTVAAVLFTMAASRGLPWRVPRDRPTGASS